ncbi:hypothetical protein [Streptomyces abikoensis]|uniref:hypothetical protein n=1 Tax=Streptomyces abikoensis TaxID=97398 RepID=UPI00167228E5|nr:hypothetical protein [Streptomyces abikoensis]GGP62751.1 hypothetical protein GCM10010214_40580 [Streptomyces abikoensis]
MPQPPVIPLTAWWAIAVAATFAFLAFFVPLMPNRRYRIRIAVAPFAAVLLVAVSALVKHHSAEVSLPLYTAAVVGFPLGFLGRRGELREKARYAAEHGSDPDNALSKGAQLQAVTVIIVVALIGSWLSMVD